MALCFHTYYSIAHALDGYMSPHNLSRCTSQANSVDLGVFGGDLDQNVAFPAHLDSLCDFICDRPISPGLVLECKVATQRASCTSRSGIFKPNLYHSSLDGDDGFAILFLLAEVDIVVLS